MTPLLAIPAIILCAWLVARAVDRLSRPVLPDYGDLCAGLAIAVGVILMVLGWPWGPP